MARRKRIARRYGGFRKFKTKAKATYSSENLMLTAGSAAVYGALRPKVEQWVSPLTSKLPVMGGYADEIALGTVGYFMAKGKLGKNRLMRSAGKAILTIEAARIGSGIGSNFVK